MHLCLQPITHTRHTPPMRPAHPSARFNKHPHSGEPSLPARSSFPLGMTKLGTQPQSITRYRNWLSSVETSRRLPSVTPAALARWEKPHSSPGTCTCSRKGVAGKTNTLQHGAGMPPQTDSAPPQVMRLYNHAEGRHPEPPRGAGVATLTRRRRGRRSR